MAIQWQVSTDGGLSYSDIAGANTTSYAVTAQAVDNGKLYRTVFANLAGIAVTAAAALSVQPAHVAGFQVSWGSSGVAPLQTAADGLRLLPSGRNVDLPWTGIDRLTVSFDEPVTLTAADVAVVGLKSKSYGPLTITPVPSAGDPAGSASTYIITLARPITAADRVTVVIGNAQVANYARRLDILPGDVNDNGSVDSKDWSTAQRLVAHAAGTTSASNADIDGQSGLTGRDVKLIRRRNGTHLPALTVAHPRRSHATHALKAAVATPAGPLGHGHAAKVKVKS